MEHLYTVSGNVNWSSYHEKQYDVSSKKLKRELPYEAAICTLQGIYPKELKGESQREIRLTFIAAIFTTAKVWKKPPHSLMNE